MPTRRFPFSSKHGPNTRNFRKQRMPDMTSTNTMVLISIGCVLARTRMDTGLWLAIVAFVSGLTFGQSVPPTTADRACYQPLESACSGKPCPSYAQSLAATKAFGEAGGCLIASSGECGPLRYTEISSGFTARSEYFHAERLVAVRTMTDAVNANSACLGWTHYGRATDCEEKPLAKYCSFPRPSGVR